MYVYIPNQLSTWTTLLLLQSLFHNTKTFFHKEHFRGTNNTKTFFQRIFSWYSRGPRQELEADKSVHRRQVGSRKYFQTITKQTFLYLMLQSLKPNQIKYSQIIIQVCIFTYFLKVMKTKNKKLFLKYTNMLGVYTM